MKTLKEKVADFLCWAFLIIFAVSFIAATGIGIYEWATGQKPDTVINGGK